MKKKILFTTLLSIALLLSNGVQNEANACGLCKKHQQYEITHLVGTPLDYSNKENWMYISTKPQHEVDLVYIYPTVAFTSKDGQISDLDNAYKKGAQSAYKLQASAFSPYTNVFVPYYRQITLSKAFKTASADDYEKFMMNSVVRTDIYAFLDTYFTKYNNGRPFILAGHSQGSAVIKVILSDYMKAHPEYLKRMVAAYPIGFGVTKEWLKANKHIKFAKGETDTGVIISWNTEGPDATIDNFLLPKNTVAINPINWKRNEKLATVEENKGSLNSKTAKIEKGAADAKLNLKRGAVICTTSTNYTTKTFKTNMFGDKSLHGEDYQLYYANIRENGLKRIEAYLGHKAK